MGKKDRHREKKIKPIVDCALSDSRYIQVLILLTAIGLVLRFYNLGFNSLWLDEATTYNIAKESFAGIWQITAGGEFNPPLFNWVEHIMLMIGNSEFILRLIPALLGVLTIPVMYFTGTEFMDRNAGLIAAALVAFSPFHIFYSQEARAYIMMLFFVALVILFYLKALKTNSTQSWIIFGACSALAFWSHFYSFVIIAALVIYALIANAGAILKDIRFIIPLISGIVVFTIACLPLIIVSIRLFITRTSSAPVFGIQGIGIVGETIRQLFGFFDISFYILLILLIIGCISLFISDKNKVVFLISTLTLSFFISFILSFKMPMVPRYLIFLIPIFFIGVAASYKMIYKVIRTPAIIYGLLILMFVISVPFYMNYYSGYSKDDWKGVAASLQKSTSPGDFVVLVPAYIIQPLDYYYSNSTDGTFEFGAYTSADLDAIAVQRINNNTAYFIVTGDIYAADPSGGSAAWLKEHTTYIGQDTGISIFVL
jgi:mannosyltransferase